MIGSAHYQYTRASPQDRQLLPVTTLASLKLKYQSLPNNKSLARAFAYAHIFKFKPRITLGRRSFAINMVLEFPPMKDMGLQLYILQQNILQTLLLTVGHMDTSVNSLQHRHAASHYVINDYQIINSRLKTYIPNDLPSDPTQVRHRQKTKT